MQSIKRRTNVRNQGAICESCKSDVCNCTWIATHRILMRSFDRTTALQTNAARASHPGRIARQNVLPLFHARGMGERRIRHRSPKRTTDTCIQQIATREANSANQSAALRWPAASPAVCGGLCEEAATPGHQRAETHSGGTLLVIHPRELPGTANSAAMLWQGLQNISLECHTLCALPRAASREKPRHTVQKLWMPAIPCGNRRKIGLEFSWSGWCCLTRYSEQHAIGSAESRFRAKTRTLGSFARILTSQLHQKPVHTMREPSCW
jgi:hypothetical protein